MKSTKKAWPLIPVLVTFCIGYSLGQTPDKETQIKMALLAAPEGVRDGATVYGFNEEGQMVTLREGTNNFICRGDDPGKDGFEVVSYHQEIEPFMARGRQLKAEGKSFKERFDIRESEAKSGALKMPDRPVTLHILYGKEVEYNEETNSMDGASFRYVVYIPFATQESTGLPLKPVAPGHPWLMDPGTHRAHIMITPPAKN